MRGKILIVEDFADWRELLSGLLQREGHQVEAVATLQEAQELSSTDTKDLDLAILDIRLVETDETNEDGMRLLAEIQERQASTQGDHDHRPRDDGDPAKGLPRVPCL